MKVKISILFTSFLLVALLAGCAQQPVTRTPIRTATMTPKATQTPKQTTPSEASPDVTTTASIVDTDVAFEKAISNTGSWIICLTKDLTVNKDLVLDGEFKNGKKDADGKDIIQRKIALYAQDENRNVTARYTLTVPKLTINSPKTSIQHGTFKGDVYVSAKDFSLVDATVEGNVYFTSDDAKNTFKMDTSSKVTGTQELKK